MSSECSQIDAKQVQRRARWVSEIGCLGSQFGLCAERLEQEIAAEIEADGTEALVAHLRLCGAIPETYGHDSSEEKLYSKYTDVVIHQAFRALGLASMVLRERSDTADVECVCPEFCFVADAKAFRLSRTAKNQKDFKVQALDSWKHGKPYAMLVCPAYQLPTRSSQIYQQAAVRSVLIGTYTHMAALVRYAEVAGRNAARTVLHRSFQAVPAMNPAKDATVYWQTVNRAFLGVDEALGGFWQEERVATCESIGIAKQEALGFLAAERERIMRLSHEEAIREVLAWRKLESRILAVESVADNGLLGVG